MGVRPRLRRTRHARRGAGCPDEVGKRTIYLNVFARQAEVNFELDGSKWHASPEDRERDARRDSALATMNIMVVRFTHDRMVRAPDEVRAEVKAIVSRRMAGKIGGGGR
jgi:very-short-patch-repair endonuclease